MRQRLIFGCLAASFVMPTAGALAEDHDRDGDRDDHRGVHTATPIQHLVVIFQENISFDHYFGTYPNAANNNPSEPVFKAAPNTPTVNGLSGPLRTATPNPPQPFRLTRAQAVTCDEGHSYGAEQKAYNFGLMNLFVESV